MMEDRSLNHTDPPLKKRTADTPSEQIVYAGILQWGTYIGLAVLVVTFVLYAGGIMEPQVPLEELPGYWKMRSTDYLDATGASTGWGWFRRIGRGDFAVLIGLVILIGITMVSTLATIPIFLKKREFIYTLLVVLELLVLMLAASGLGYTGRFATGGP